MKTFMQIRPDSAGGGGCWWQRGLATGAVQYAAGGRPPRRGLCSITWTRCNPLV